MKQLNQELLNSINDVSGNIDTYSRNYELALNTLIDNVLIRNFTTKIL